MFESESHGAKIRTLTGVRVTIGHIIQHRQRTKLLSKEHKNAEKNTDCGTGEKITYKTENTEK
jgi:hypothetical protein